MLRLDALGDTLLSTPAIRSLQLTWPSAQLRVFTHPAGSVVLRSWVDIEEVGPDTPLSERVREYAPDCVLVFSEKRRAVTAAYKSGAPRRIGFDPGLTQPLKSLWLRVALTDRLAYPNDLTRDPGMHEVERYLALTRLAGAKDYTGGLHLPMDVEKGKAWMAEHGLERPWAVQLTPKWLLGGWSVEWLQTVVGRLPHPLVAFYGPAEKEWAEQHFANEQLCYQPDLLEYAAVLSQCRALITVDTGAAHVAAAVGTPVVDIFPEKHSAHCVRRWRPWQVEHRVVLKPEWRSDLEESLRNQIGEACRGL